MYCPYKRRPFQSGGKLNAWLRSISTNAYKQQVSRLSLFWNGLHLHFTGVQLSALSSPPQFIDMTIIAAIEDMLCLLICEDVAG